MKSNYSVQFATNADSYAGYSEVIYAVSSHKRERRYPLWHPSMSSYWLEKFVKADFRK